MSGVCLEMPNMNVIAAPCVMADMTEDRDEMNAMTEE
jgi:hypothetical protein